MDYQDEHDAYEEYEDADYYRGRAGYQTDSPALVQQALDWGISGSILAILVLTALYLFSPIDFVPDLIPVAGQADDLAAVLAGSGTVTFLTIVRFLLRTRVGRWGCLIAIVFTAMGAFLIFWLLMSLFESLV